MNSLLARDIHKYYGNSAVLRGVDFQLERGTLTALVGDNGSGKSTLLRILAGLSAPTDGHIHYERASKLNRSLRHLIGFVGHESMLYAELTGRENLSFFGSLYHLPKLNERIASLSQRFAMEEWLDRHTGTYSRGQRQRLALARALMHAPELLLLDEPLSSLDEPSMHAVIEALRQEQQDGCIIVMSTHNLSAIASFTPQVIRLQRGKALLE